MPQLRLSASSPPQTSALCADRARVRCRRLSSVQHRPETRAGLTCTDHASPPYSPEAGAARADAALEQMEKRGLTDVSLLLMRLAVCWARQSPQTPASSGASFSTAETVIASGRLLDRAAEANDGRRSGCRSGYLSGRLCRREPSTSGRGPEQHSWVRRARRGEGELSGRRRSLLDRRPRAAERAWFARWLVVSQKRHVAVALLLDGGRR